MIKKTTSTFRLYVYVSLILLSSYIETHAMKRFDRDGSDDDKLAEVMTRLSITQASHGHALENDRTGTLDESETSKVFLRTKISRVRDFLSQQPSPLKLKKIESTYTVGFWEGNIPGISTQDLLAFNTVPIKVHKQSIESNGIKKEFSEKGTGFFIETDYGENNPALNNKYNVSNSPVLVTCRHCIEDYPPNPEFQGSPGEFIKFFILKFHYVDLKSRKFTLLQITLENQEKGPRRVPWVCSEKDLAFLQIGNILLKGKEHLDGLKSGSNHYPFFRAIKKEDYSPGCLKNNEFGYLSDVIMFGYPYELSGTNSMPLARFGHCSSDPKQSINGFSDFYVDMATINGSSGSPVWFFRKKYKGKLENKKIDVSNAELENVDVEIHETYEVTFAGMVIAGAEKDDPFDIHLGIVINTSSILDFLKIKPRDYMTIGEWFDNRNKKMKTEQPLVSMENIEN